MRTTMCLRLAATTGILAFQLVHSGCTFIFSMPLSVAEKEEVRLPPPDAVPLFNDPAIHDGTPGSKHRFGSALAAGHFSRPVAGNENVELAIGVPGAADGSGKVVQILKPAAGGQFLHDVVPGDFAGLAKNSRFGAALAAGDFDGDGFDDLAIGAPDHETTGAVAVLYGGPARRQVLVPPDDVAGRRGFGSALAAGDLDSDGLVDLVIGEPGADNAGGGPARVWVVWGRRPADGNLSLQVATQIAIPAGDEQDNTTLFGASLAIGNFVPRRDRSIPTRPDIAIGAPKFDGPSRRDVGRVYVFEPVSLDPQTDGFALAVTLEPHNGWEEYANDFGHVLIAGNFNADRVGGEEATDLAIGAPASSIPEQDGFDTTFGQPSGRGRESGAGLVFIAPYRETGVSLPLRVLSQERMGLSQKSDHFGWSLAAGDFNRDGVDDLAIGSPNERMAAVFGLSGASEAGAIYFRFGNAGDWDALADPGGIPQIPLACFDYIDAVRGASAARSGDHFGTALLAAFFDADDAIDLIVGAPDADVSAATGVMKDAGMTWIGLNRETRPGPFEGTFAGTFRDDACGGDPAAITMIVRNREQAVCGVFQAERPLCFAVTDEDNVHVDLDVSVTAGNVDDSTVMHLEYVLHTNAGDNIGTLFVDAKVQDAASDMTLDLRFEGRGDAKDVERSIDNLVLDRQ